MAELKTLKGNVQKRQASVKKAKAAFKTAEDKPQKVLRKRVLKGMKTKLKTSQAAYKAAKPKGKIHTKVDQAKESVLNAGKKIPFKKALSWTGLAVATVITAVGGFVVYDYLNGDGEIPIKDSM